MTQSKLTFANDELVEQLNEKIRAGSLTNRIGEVIKSELDGGLVNSSEKLLLPIRGQIIVMLKDKCIDI